MATGSGCSRLCGLLVIAGCGGGPATPATDAGVDAATDAATDAAIVILAHCTPPPPPHCVAPPIVASSGRFGFPRFTAAGHNTYGLGVADLDGDCRLDVAVTNADDDDVGVLLGNGDGSLRRPVTYPVGDFPTALVVADLDQDGAPEVASNGRGISVLRNHADGTLAPAVAYPAAAFDLAAADVDGNGCLDLVSESQMLLNLGDGTFAPPTAVSAHGGRLGVGDFDGDGAPDLAVAGYDGATYGLEVFLDDGAGHLRPPARYPYGDSNAGGVAIGDLDGDGDLDVVMPIGIGAVSVVPNRGDGTFAAAQVTRLGTDQEWVGPALGDLDGDGDLDLVVATRMHYAPPSAGTTVEVFLNRGDGTLAAPVSYPVSAGSPANVAIRDLDGDGRADLVVAIQYGGVTVLLGQP